MKQVGQFEMPINTMTELLAVWLFPDRKTVQKGPFVVPLAKRGKWLRIRANFLSLILSKILKLLKKIC